MNVDVLGGGRIDIHDIFNVISNLCICLRLTKCISNCTKLVFTLLHVSPTCCGRHQGAVLLL